MARRVLLVLLVALSVGVLATSLAHAQAGGGSPSSSSEEDTHGPSTQATLTELLEPTVDHILTVYIPGVVVLAILWIVLFLRPFIGLVLYMALLPFHIVVLPLGGAEVVLGDLVMPPAILGWVMRSFRSEQPRLPLKKSGLEAPLVLFFFWTLLSFFWAIGYAGAMSKIVQMVYAGVLFYMCLDLIERPRQLQLIVVAWVVGQMFNSVYQVIDSFSHHGRSGGFQQNSMEAAMDALYGLSLTLGFWLGIRGLKRRAMILFGFIVQLVSFVVANCRGPMAGFAVGYLVPFVKSRDARRFAFLSLGIFMVAYLALGGFLETTMGISLPSPIHRFFTENRTVDVGLLYRLDIWHSILTNIIPTSPILGIGPGSLSTILMNWGHRAFGQEHEAHSMYLEVLTAFGPIGLALMLWFWGAYLRLLWRYYPAVEDRLCRGAILAGACAVIAKLVASATYGYYIEDRAQWLTLGVVLAFARQGLMAAGRTDLLPDGDSAVREAAALADAPPLVTESA